MNDTNFISGIVKILETPKQQIMSENIIMTTFRVQFPQVRKNSIVFLKVWGNLVDDVVKYYNVNDYILIEGYLAIENGKNRNSKLQKIEITVLKTYPFLFN